MKVTDFSLFLTKYLGEYLPGQRNVSHNTIRSYSDTFRLFLHYCEEEKGINTEKLTLSKFDAKLVSDFLNWLETERKCGPRTRNQRLAGIHSFVRYIQPDVPMYLKEMQRILGIPNKKMETPSLGYLSVEATSALFKMPESESKAGRRDLMILVLLYDTGARVQELVDLTVRDVRTMSPATVTLHGKGRKIRSIPIMSDTNKMMIQYLREQRLMNRPEMLDFPLFFNRKHEKMTRAGITYILNKYFCAAKANNPQIVFPDRITPHVLRHTKAMHMLQSGINLIYIRDYLGHVNVSTTEIYAKADAEIKRKALEASAIKARLPETDQGDWCTNKSLMEWLKDLSSF